MMNLWKRVALCTGLAAAMTVGPEMTLSAYAEPPTEAQRLEKIERDLKELKEAVEKVTAALGSVKLQDIATDLAALKLDVQIDKDKIKSLGNDLAGIKSDLESLRSKAASPARISGFGPSETAQPMGRVELTNNYPQEMTVVINNARAYQVRPNEIRLTDPIPAGTFSYEVIGVTDRRVRALPTDKVYPIYIHPQS